MESNKANKDIIFHDSIADKVTDRIRKAIISREYTPGQRLTEKELCDKYKVSRTPIREAFRQLQAEGYLVYTTHYGVIVTELSIQEIKDIWEVRNCLEEMVVLQAARRITAEQIKVMLALAVEMEGLAKSPDDIDQPTFQRLDQQMYSCIVSNCSNERLKNLVLGLNVNSSLIRNLSGYSSERAKVSFREHIQLAKAIAAHDEITARECLREHFEASYRAFTKVFYIEPVSV
jgi:DNA-binding GntR family transcriptional regulator